MRRVAAAAAWADAGNAIVVELHCIASQNNKFLCVFVQANCENQENCVKFREESQNIRGNICRNMKAGHGKR